jgi:hypothetical protein
VVRHAAQQQVHGEDGAQECGGVKNLVNDKISEIQGLKPIFLPLSDTGVKGFEIQCEHGHKGNERDDAHRASNARPSAETGQILPYSVAQHFSAAAPPKQQPVLQSIAYPTTNSTNYICQNLIVA